MKDLILAVTLALTFAALGFRIYIQITSCRIFKKDDGLKKVGADNILFFVPEITPIKHFTEELGDDISRQAKAHFRKIYRKMLIAVLLLYGTLFFVFK